MSWWPLRVNAGVGVWVCTPECVSVGVGVRDCTRKDVCRVAEWSVTNVVRVITVGRMVSRALEVQGASLIVRNSGRGSAPYLCYPMMLGVADFLAM